ncbi:MAG: chorismate mutase [Acidimicrobiia bacterium]
MTRGVQALRGATTVDVDEPDHITERVVTLMRELYERNGLTDDDVISAIFTSTPDIHSIFPATAARKFGMADVPLLGAQEAFIESGTTMCIRVMLHVNTDRPRSEVRHVYLERAASLRSDLSQ